MKPELPIEICYKIAQQDIKVWRSCIFVIRNLGTIHTNKESKKRIKKHFTETTFKTNGEIKITVELLPNSARKEYHYIDDKLCKVIKNVPPKPGQDDIDQHIEYDTETKKIKAKYTISNSVPSKEGAHLLFGKGAYVGDYITYDDNGKATVLNVTVNIRKHYLKLWIKRIILLTVLYLIYTCLI